ncbi:MAG: hypothetical protein RSF82_12480 [Angelakisella sp.]
MKKINWKLLNLALWVEVILSYLLPFKTVNNFEYKVGFPVPFLSVYDTAIGVNPMMSMHLNPLGLLFNAVIIYLIISFCIRVYQKTKVQTTK